MLLCLCLLLSIICGFLLVWVLWPKGDGSGSGLLVKLSLAVGVGLGLCACTLFVIMLFCGPARNAIIITDLAVLLVLGVVFAVVLLRQEGESSVDSQKQTKKPWLTKVLLVGFFLLLLTGLATFVLTSSMRPHGHWDAWAFWNLRAKHLVEFEEDEWQRSFTDDRGTRTKPNYPPLLPLTIVRCWKWTSSETTLAPVLVSGLFTFAAVGLLVGASRPVASPAKTWTAGIVLLGTPFFISHATRQYAEHPLAFFFLATVVLMVLHDRSAEKSYGLLTLAGITCGLAGFTKNEGLLFLAAAVVTWLWLNVVRGDRETRFQKLAAFAAGLAPVLLVLTYFKMQIAAGTSQVAMMESGTTMKKVFTLSRYGQILKALVDQLFLVKTWSVFWLVLPLYGLLVGFEIPERHKRGAYTCLGIIGIMLVGYFAFYVVTPQDLAWHLGSSLDRLLLHLWPTILFAFFFITRSPEEIATEKEAAV